MLINVVTGLVVVYLLGAVLYWWLTIPRPPKAIDPVPVVVEETTQDQGLKLLHMNKWGGSEYK